MENAKERAIEEIAREIEADWIVMKNWGARRALAFMKTMESLDAPVGPYPDGYAVIKSFLCNAVGWRGPAARRIKKELRQIQRPRGVRESCED